MYKKPPKLMSTIYQGINISLKASLYACKTTISKNVNLFFILITMQLLWLLFRREDVAIQFFRFKTIRVKSVFPKLLLAFNLNSRIILKICVFFLKMCRLFKLLLVFQSKHLAIWLNTVLSFINYYKMISTLC